MGKVHDALEHSGYDGHDLEQFLVRLLFCLFADDTGIFEPRGIFETLVKDRTAEDGSDLGQWISQLFDVVNTPDEKRYKTLDEDLAAFPYINGDLFKDRLPIPAFNAAMRNVLIEACEFSWGAISPAIFGSLFQSVMNKAERRKAGAHYTTEKNIMKVISPLFLDDLRVEFEAIKARKTQRTKLLAEFQNRLSTLTFFDPACGCGNFLIIAYRELRQLELEVLVAMRKDQQLTLDATSLSKVDVDQFYGIEIGEFPARIAEAAMWMMDHIMNNRLSLEFGQTYVRIPLRKSPHILFGDALETPWENLLPSSECSFVLGNPPFIGAKYQDDEQRAQVRRIAALGKSGGTLDYVTAWFLKAGEYVQDGSARIYIPERMHADSSDSVAVEIFERIAKEGRKYGIGLVVISQRPSEVNRTVLSQCNNVVAMRLTNGDDQSVIKRLLQDSLGSFDDLLPVLDIGEALVVGDASLLPTRVRIAEPKMKPDSQTVAFWDRWNEEKPKSDTPKSIRSWRRQSMK